jgi:hypothetical protein
MVFIVGGGTLGFYRWEVLSHAPRATHAWPARKDRAGSCQLHATATVNQVCLAASSSRTDGSGVKPGNGGMQAKPVGEEWRRLTRPATPAGQGHTSSCCLSGGAGAAVASPSWAARAWRIAGAALHSAHSTPEVAAQPQLGPAKGDKMPPPRGCHRMAAARTLAGGGCPPAPHSCRMAWEGAGLSWWGAAPLPAGAAAAAAAPGARA